MFVLTRAQVPDIQTGFELRKTMYQHMSVTMPNKPANKVLFWLRKPGHARELQNTEELIAIAKRYNLSYTYVAERRDEIYAVIQVGRVRGFRLDSPCAG